MTLPEVKSAQAALNLLRAAVEVRGEDYVYAPLALKEGGGVCRYVDNDGCPSCIVGLALALAGADIEDLKELDNRWVGVLSAEYLHEIAPISSEASDIFSAAQSAQDLGKTWGQALREARSYARAIEFTN